MKPIDMTVTVELCQEDRARLDAILAALQSCGTPYAVAAAQEPQEAPAPEPEAEPAPEPETPGEDAPAVTHSDVQKKVVALSASGKKDQVREIVLAYNNTKVSDIPDDKLAEVWDKLTALEG